VRPDATRTVLAVGAPEMQAFRDQTAGTAKAGSAATEQTTPNTDHFSI
jgi:hypothetical protein